jgi:DNA-binding GntR family transcriptional regulator
MVINKASLTDQIYNLLKQKILQREFELGQQLKTRQIAEDNGISLMPVRDALRRLSNEGLVDNKPRVGFFVKNFSENEINDILEVRKMHELYCLENYFAEINRQEIKKLEGKFEKNSSASFFNRYDIKLHQEIVKASHNQYLIDSYFKLINHFTMLFNYLNHKRSKFSRQEHTELVKCILNNNKEKAYRLLYRHLDRVEIAADAKLD